ncbi:MAG: DUF134 domain-containing protein [Methanothrix sp.]|nr:DUF134 domain-containing protein [Methanothrix sp.]
MCPCRGRRRGRRWISEIPSVRCFMPDGCPKVEAISMSLEELEALRLVDLLDLDQEESAFYMGISRKALWNDLMNARKKVAACLVYGMGLRIEGGSYLLRGEEVPDGANQDACTQQAELMQREMMLLRTRLDYLSNKIAEISREEMSKSNTGKQSCDSS